MFSRSGTATATALAVVCVWTAACEETRPRSGGRAPHTSPADASSLAGDGGLLHSDAAQLDAAPSDLGGADDAGAVDAAPADTGAAIDATARADAANHADASSPPDAGSGAGTVSLATTGCTADFGGDLVVSYNGSIAVGSLRGAALVASLQFDLSGQTGLIQLSSQHRIQTGLVVNLVTWSTWTNLAQDPDAITGVIPDPISGSLLVRAYDPAQGIMDIELQGVTIQNVSDLSFCTLDGRVQTTRLGR